MKILAILGPVAAKGLNKDLCTKISRSFGASAHNSLIFPDISLNSIFFQQNLIFISLVLYSSSINQYALANYTTPYSRYRFIDITPTTIVSFCSVMSGLGKVPGNILFCSDNILEIHG